MNRVNDVKRLATRRITSLLLVVSMISVSIASHAQQPTEPVEFAHARITDAWKVYGDVLSFG